MSNIFLSGYEFDEIIKGWEAKQNNNGVIYYVNNDLQITSWMHPYLKKILDSIEEKYSLVKYAAYRTSLKLRAIQSQTGIEWMNITAIKQVFMIDEEQDKEVSCTQALDLIKEILVLSDHHHQHEAERLGAAEVILNLMMCLYDVNRAGKLLYRSIGNALTALCKAKLNDKYKYFFTHLKDEENKVRKESLLFFIKDLMEITGIIKESLAFGTSVMAAVDSCLKSAGKPERDWVSEEDFYSWLLQEPQTFVWLPTLHRVQATEIVAHDVRCFVCQVMPIIGFRYRCLQCLNYNLCQNCFLHGLTSLQHKLKHPMKEYCFPTTTKDNTKAFLDIMKNKLIRRHRQQLKKNYLPVEDSGETREFFEWQPKYFHTDPEACISASTDSGLAICSDNGEMQDIKICAFFVEDEIKARAGASPDFLGLPCSTSSPLFGSHDQVVELLSKHDIEMQQKGMARKIKQLQQENRILQMKLHTIQKKYDLDKSSLAEVEAYMDYSLKIPNNSSLSPVCNATAGVDLKTEDLVIHHDTLSIVGPITPVQSLSSNNGDVISNNGEAISPLVSSLREKLKLDDSGHEPTNNNPQEQTTNDLGTVETEKPTVQIENNDSCDTVLSNQLMYQSCDMSLTFEDTIGNSLADTDRKSIPKYFTDKPSVIANDINKPCVQMDNSERQSVLVYQSCDMSLDVVETDEKLLKETTEKSLEDPLKSFNNPCDCEDEKNKEPLYQNNPEGIVHGKFSSQTEHSLISESPNGSKLPNRPEASTRPSSFEKGQPRLVFSSSLQSFKSNKSDIKGKKSKLGNKVLLAENKAVDGSNCQDEKIYNLRNFDNSSMCSELSEIFPTSVCVSPSFSHHHLLNLTQVTPAKTVSKKKPMDPVHMSTPVNANQLHSSSRSATVNQMPLSNYHNRDENKENFSLVTSVKKTIKGHPVAMHGPEITPLSSIPQWHRKRILLSCNSVPSTSNNSNDATKTLDSAAGLTQIFQKADRIGELINQDVSDMATEDMDEFEKLMMEFEKECMNGQLFSPEKKVAEKKSEVDDDSDILKAVNNLGDAMSDLVQATAKY